MVYFQATIRGVFETILCRPFLDELTSQLTSILGTHTITTDHNYRYVLWCCFCGSYFVKRHVFRGFHQFTVLCHRSYTRTWNRFLGDLVTPSPGLRL